MQRVPYYNVYFNVYLGALTRYASRHSPHRRRYISLQWRAHRRRIGLVMQRRTDRWRRLRPICVLICVLPNGSGKRWTFMSSQKTFLHTLNPHWYRRGSENRLRASPMHVPRTQLSCQWRAFHHCPFSYHVLVPADMNDISIPKIATIVLRKKRLHRRWSQIKRGTMHQSAFCLS